MSDGRQPRGQRIPFPLVAGRHPAGEPPPTAGVQFAGQIRMFIGVSGYVDGLYICDTNLAGTWGWYKIHGHGQPLNAQSFTGGATVSGGLGVTGSISASGSLSGSSLAATTVGATTVNATTVNLTTLNFSGGTPWRTILKSAVVSHDPPSIAAGALYTFSIPLSGAVTNDVAMVTSSGATIGIVPYAVAGTNEVFVCLQNVTTGAINPNGNNWVAAVIK